MCQAVFPAPIGRGKKTPLVLRPTLSTQQESASQSLKKISVVFRQDGGSLSGQADLGPPAFQTHALHHSAFSF